MKLLNINIGISDSTSFSIENIKVSLVLHGYIYKDSRVNESSNFTFHYITMLIKKIMVENQ